jgi:protein-S-isoprenylcysteine O-methyltransferase Ste14
MTDRETLFRWCGGALFVASLGWTAWAYAVDWGRGGPFLPGRGLRAAAADALLVSVFAAHHSLFARDRVKTALAPIVPDRLLRSTYVWAASLLLAAVVFWWRPVGGVLYDAAGAAAAACHAVQLAGAALVAAAVRAIDPLDLAGIRTQGDDPGSAPAADAAPLQVGGPYRLVRHPLYLGWILVVFGAARMTGDRLLFAALTTAYLVIAVPWEERSLTRAFGGAYVRYRAAVRWRIIPFVY